MVPKEKISQGMIFNYCSDYCFGLTPVFISYVGPRSISLVDIEDKKYLGEASDIRYLHKMNTPKKKIKEYLNKINTLRLDENGNPIDD